MEFLIDEYGQVKMLELLDMFEEGAPEDRALLAVHGMDRNGLEAAWRQWVGASPMESIPTVGPTPTRTSFPTLPPITGPTMITETPQTVASHIATQTPTDSTTSVPSERLEPQQRANTTRTRVFVAGGLAVVLLLIGWSILRRRRTG